MRIVIQYQIQNGCNRFPPNLRFVFFKIIKRVGVPADYFIFAIFRSNSIFVLNSLVSGVSDYG